MTNLHHLAVLNDGVPRWNAWREAHPDVRPELSGAHLAGRDLVGINFSKANLVSADLSRTNLSRANFRTAILQHATLRATCLREADLTEVCGVSDGQLGGADLAEAKLPDTLLKREGLAELEGTAKSLQQLFFVVLAGCVYAGLTIATTSHARLLTNATSSELPIIRTSIPIVQFYAVAPALLLVLHLYFHCALHRLWEMVAAVPAVFPDHQALDKTVDLGLFRAIALSPRRWWHSPRRPLRFHVQTLLWSPTLWVVPLTLLWFWLHYLPRHDWQGTLWHVVLLGAATGSTGVFYGRAVATLHGYTAETAHGAAALAMAVTLAVVLLLSHAAIQGVSVHAAPWSGVPRASIKTVGARTWRPLVFSLVGIECCVAQLEEEQVSTKPPHWQTQYDAEHDLQQAIELVAGARLAGSDLAFARARRAFLTKADLRGASLRGADLFMAQLQGADLSQADLRGADLSWAYLQRADLSGATLADANLQGANLSHRARLIEANLQNATLIGGYLTKADLSLADLQGADLSSSSLQGAILPSANLQGATLAGADLRAADFSDAQLDAADLSNTWLQQAVFARTGLSGVTFYGAQLQGATLARADLSGATFALAQLHHVNLSHTNLQSANLSGASLQQADLSRANLGGANLRGADLAAANFDGADLQGANLQDVIGLTTARVQQAAHWELACYSKEMLGRLKLGADHNGAVRKRLDEERKPIAHECVS